MPRLDCVDLIERGFRAEDDDKIRRAKRFSSRFKDSMKQFDREMAYKNRARGNDWSK